VLKTTAPVTGNQPRSSEKTEINSMASQKLGTATPNEANDITMLSTHPPWRLAANTPKGAPMRNEKNRARITISAVCGRQRAIETLTGSPVNNDFDKSP